MDRRKGRKKNLRWENQSGVCHTFKCKVMKIGIKQYQWEWKGKYGCKK
jgi:hypothetical protein